MNLSLEGLRRVSRLTPGERSKSSHKMLRQFSEPILIHPQLESSAPSFCNYNDFLFDLFFIYRALCLYPSPCLIATLRVVTAHDQFRITIDNEVCAVA